MSWFLLPRFLRLAFEAQTALTSRRRSRHWYRDFRPRTEALEIRCLLAGTQLQLGTAGTINSFAGVGFQENEVATLAASMNGQPDPTIGDFNAQINWGGAQSKGDLVYLGVNGSFAEFLIKGTHTYSQTGTNLPISVTVTGPGGTSVTSTTTAATVKAMPSGIPGSPPSTTSNSAPKDVAVQLGTSGQIFSYAGVGFQENEVATVAVSVNNQPDTTLSDIHAQINWGDDDSWSPGDLVYQGTNGSYAEYLVKGSHTYDSSSNSIPIVVYVTGPDGTSASLQTTDALVSLMPSGIPGSQPSPTANSSSPEHVVVQLGTSGQINSYAGVGFQENEVATVAISVNDEPDSSLSDIHAQINWGDDDSWSPGDLVYQGTNGSYAEYLIKGSHTYDQAANSIPIVVFVNGPDGTSASLNTTVALVRQMPSGIPGTQPSPTANSSAPEDVQLQLGSAGQIAATEGVKTALVEVATLAASVNGVPDKSLTHFHAQINWGDDDSWTAGTLLFLGTNGSYAEYQIKGSHLYETAKNNYPIVVYVNGPDGTSISNQTTNAIVSPNLLKLGELSQDQWDDAEPGYHGEIPISGGSGTYTPPTVTGLPTGLAASLSQDVVDIDGTPTQSGTFHVQVSEGDNQGHTNQQTFQLTINAPVTLGTLNPAKWIVNQAGYHGTIGITGGTGSYGNLQVSGLPSGLSAALSGGTIVVSGTPTVAGAFNISVSVKDTDGESASAVEHLQIKTVLTLGTLAPTQWDVNRPGYYGTIAVAGGSGSYTGLTATGLPTGLHAVLAGSVVTVSGTPTASGSFNNVVVSLQDSDGTMVNRTYSLTITAQSGTSPNAATGLVLKLESPSANVPENSGVPIQITAVGPSGATSTSVNGPASILLNGRVVDNIYLHNGTGTGVITTPKTAGPTTFRVNDQPAPGKLLTATITINVQTTTPENPATDPIDLLKRAGDGAKAVTELLKGLLEGTYADATAFEKAALKSFEDLATKLGGAVKALNFVPLALDLVSLWQNYEQGHEEAFGKAFSNTVSDALKLGISWGYAIIVDTNPVGAVGGLLLSTAVDQGTEVFYKTFLESGFENEGQNLYRSLKGGGNELPKSGANGVQVRSVVASSDGLLDTGVYAVRGTSDVTVIVNPGINTGAANVSAAGQYINAQVSSPFSGVVATFTDATNNTDPSHYQAYIGWGNVYFNRATITALPGGGFSVSGVNTYALTGLYTTTVVILSTDGSVASAYGRVSVSPAPPSSATPIATILAPNITSQNADILAPYDFDVVYQATQKISASTIAGGMIQVKTSSGQVLTAQALGSQPMGTVDAWGNATTIVVTYRIAVPLGSWRAVPQGTYTINLVGTAVRDLAGNAVAFGSKGTFQVAAAPSLVVKSGGTFVYSGGVNITNSSNLVLSGIAPANSTVHVYNGTTLVGNTTALSNGNWTLNDTAADGSYDFTAKYTTPQIAMSLASTDVAVRVDHTAPHSNIVALPATSPSTFTLGWSGSDGTTGSGIGRYTIYFNDNGGAFKLLLANVVQTSMNFVGVSGHTYGFYSVATDVAGNVQVKPVAAQATTKIEPAITLGGLTPSQWIVNKPGYLGTITVAGGTGIYSHLTVTGLPTGLSATLSGNTVTIAGTPTQTGSFTNITVSLQDSIGGIGSRKETLTITTT